MFLWVATVLEYFRTVELDSEENFKLLFDKILDDINAVYIQCLNQLSYLSELDKIWVKEIICWSVMGMSNLKTDEIKVETAMSRQIWLGQVERPSLDDVEKTVGKCSAFLTSSLLEPRILQSRSTHCA